jgi:hypothetical protein
MSLVDLTHHAHSHIGACSRAWGHDNEKGHDMMQASTYHNGVIDGMLSPQPSKPDCPNSQDRHTLLTYSPHMHIAASRGHNLKWFPMSPLGALWLLFLFFGAWISRICRSITDRHSIALSPGGHELHHSRGRKESFCIAAAWELTVEADSAPQPYGPSRRTTAKTSRRSQTV